MGKWILIVAIWYHFAGDDSEKTWKFMSQIKDINSKEECEKLAAEELKKVTKFSTKYYEKEECKKCKKIIRPMKVVAFKYLCEDQTFYNTGIRKEEE